MVRMRGCSKKKQQEGLKATVTAITRRVIFLIISCLLLIAVFLLSTALGNNTSTVDCTDCHNNAPRAGSEIKYLIQGVLNPATINVPAGGSFEINFLFDEMNNPTQTGGQIVCEPFIGLPQTGSGGTGTMGLPWPRPTRGTAADVGTGLSTTTGDWMTVFEASDSNGVVVPPADADQWITRATNNTGIAGGPDMPVTHEAYATNYAGSSWAGQNGAALDDGSEPDLTTALMGTDVTIAVPSAASGTYIVYIAGVGHNESSGRANVMTTLTVNVTAPAVPTAPTIGTPTAISASSIRWNLTDNALYESGFKVHDTTDTVMVSRYETNVTYVEETGLTANTEYARHVHAFNGAGDSAASANATAYTLTNAPIDPTAAADSPSQITVSWAAPAGGADHYHVKSSSDGYASLVYDNVLATCTEGLLLANTHYTYRIYGVNADGMESAAYAEVAAYTHIQEPSGVAFGTVALTGIDVSASGELSFLTAASSGILITNITTSADSGWLQTNSWTSDSLSPNTQYSFKAQARNGDGVLTAETGSFEKYTLPNSPVAPVASAASTSQINVSWTAGVGGADHYHVRSSSDDFASLVHDNAATSFVETLLSPNTQYTYRIFAVNADGLESASYAEVSRYTMIQAPTGVIFGPITQESIAVSARGVLSNLTSGLSAVLLSNITLATGSGWTNTNAWITEPLAQNTEYSFKAQARNGDGVASAESGVFAKYSLPEVPASATATADSTTQIDVSWTAGTGGADHYHVRSSSDGYATVKYDGTGLAYSEGSLSPNTQYTYRVYAINADGTPRAAYTSVSRYTLTPELTGITFGMVTPFSISVSAAGGMPNLDAGLSGVLFTNTTASVDSGWVKINPWPSEPLVPSTEYSFKAQTRNGDGIENAETPLFSTTTLVEISGTPDVTITSPTVAQEVSGQLPLIGTASADNPPFDRYVIEYGRGATPTSWVKYGSTHSSAVWNNTLETINTLRLNNEIYTFRVTVTDTEGNTTSASVPVSVVNNVRPAAPHGSYQLDSAQCALCHSSHTAIGNPGILRFGAVQNQSQLCYSCHDGTASIYNIAVAFDTNASHHPIRDVTYENDPEHTLDCSSCHDPHGSEEVDGQPVPRLLRSTDSAGTKSYGGNPFCYSCHGVSGSIKDMRYFETGNAHNNTDPGQTEIFANPASGTKIKCSMCHEPAGSPQTRLRKAAGKALCEPCHPDSLYTTRTDNEVVVGVGYPDTAFGQPFYAAVRVFTQDTFTSVPVLLAGPREYRVPHAPLTPRTRAVCVADANNDGKDEILMTIADGASSALVIGVQASNGYSIQPLAVLDGYGGYGVAVGDIDADSNNEIIVTSLGLPVR